MREADLRCAVAAGLIAQGAGVVLEWKAIRLANFTGVGGADIALLEANGNPSSLAETKWSTDRRDKIFEAAWDAVKLALAKEKYGLEAAWLVTGASRTAWAETECSDLFENGEVDVRALWDRQLRVPGPNGGATVGDDLERGSSRMFDAAHARLRVRLIAAVPIAGDWEIRGAAVTGAGRIGPFTRRLKHERRKPSTASSSVDGFPRRITRSWLKINVPRMDVEEFERLLARMRRSGWTDSEFERDVYPLRPPS